VVAVTDFDDVLERLLNDPSFASALAADPEAALRGYSLDPSERDLLTAQVVHGPGEERTVEMRTSKSGVVGMLGPVAAMLGAAAHAPTGSQVFGTAPAGATFGQAPSDAQTFGAAPMSDSGGGTTGNETFGAVNTTESVGSAPTGEGMGQAPVRAHDYHTWVDTDGDGRWDKHVDYERADGGVDIVVDKDHDGRADFIGHDYDRDGLVDVADYDKNHDGGMDTRMYDDTGDGWMDRSTHLGDADQR
jgi:hypothetical protein